MGGKENQDIRYSGEDESFGDRRTGIRDRWVLGCHDGMKKFSLCSHQAGLRLFLCHSARIMDSAIDRLPVSACAI